MTIKNLLRNKKLQIFFFIVVLIGAGLVLYLLFGQKGTIPQDIPSPITNQNYELSQTDTIKYTGDEITPPTKMAIYSNSHKDIQDLASELANKLDLVQSDFSSLVWTSGDRSKILSLDNYSNNLEYSNENTSGSKPTTDIAINNSLAFLEELGLAKNVSTQPTKITYYQGFELASSSKEDADVIELYFSQNLNGFPLTVGFSQFSDILIRVGSNNKVIKAIFPQRITPDKQTDELRTLSFEAIISLVDHGKGSIIEIRTPNGGAPKNTALGDIVLSSARLEYRLEPNNERFLPYYRFLGTSVAKNTNEEVSVIIVIPAVIIPES